MKINSYGTVFMRFFITTALSTAALLALSACGGSSDKSEAKSPETQKPVEIQAPEPDTSTPTPVETAATPAETPDTPEVTETAAAAGSTEFADLPAPYNEADYARGKRVYKLCVSCHLIEEGAGNLVGPNLHGLFDRNIGTLEGFNYSDPVKEADFQWTAEKLDEWLANPRSFLPGNRMSFAGVRKPTDRNAVIAYLMVESAK